MEMENERLVPLNIVMTYPVHWNKREILRDFVQNFYDSLNNDNWNSKFNYHYDAPHSALTMEVQDVTFNYEWLLHIGASTKTNSSEQYAGYFGEGFKIASLCAFRDYRWKIEMYSGDWGLFVETIEKTIDNQSVKMLAYRVFTVPETNRSKLVLTGLSKSDHELMESIMLSFFYPENPLLGKKIYADNQVAVYERSSTKMPRSLPQTSDFNPVGAVFCAYQMLGTHPFNMVVCLHRYKTKDRERRTLYRHEVHKIFEDIACYISPEGAYYMLLKMQRNWLSYYKKHIDIHSWSNTIDVLIHQIAKSETTKAAFVAQYPNLLCVDPIRTMRERNRRFQAKAWMMKQSVDYRLVKNTFQLLGYPFLEDECEKNNGFVQECELFDEKTKKCYAILEGLCRTLCSDFYAFEYRWPQTQIILNDSAPYHGMARLYKSRKSRYNLFGMKIRSDIDCVFLKKSIFVKSGFYDAVSTYTHELCHEFGGDSSQSFSLALSRVMEILLLNGKTLDEYHRKWENVFEESTITEGTSNDML